MNAPLTSQNKDKETEYIYNKAIITFSNDAIVMTSITGIVESWNPAAKRMYGYTAKEIIGKPIDIVNPFEQREEFKNLMEKVKEGQRINEFETTGVRKNKSEISIALSIAPIKNGEGSIVGIVTIARDITERKKIEQALKESEERFRLVFENSIDLMALLDKEGNYMYVCPSHERILGYTSSDLVGKNISTVIHQEDLPLLLEDIRKTLQGELATNFYFRLRCKNGNWIIAEGSAQIIRDNTQKPMMIVAVARDISERKKLENNIRFLSEAGDVFSSSLDVTKTLQSIAQLTATYIGEWCSIDIINEQGEIEAAAVGHKDTEKMKLGIEYRKVFPRDFHAPVGVWKAIDTGKPYLWSKKDLEMLQKIMEGKGFGTLARKLHFTAALNIPLRVREKIIGALSFASSLEGAKYTKNDVLFAEEIARRAAIAIENARLYSQAQQAIKSRDDFFSMASHELKTPLTTMKIFSEIALRVETLADTSKLVELLKKIRGQIEQLNMLITDMLDVSRIQQGKLELNPEQIDLKDLISETLENFQYTTNHTFVTDLHEDGVIYADRYRLREVLSNLIDNAIKYSPNQADIIIHSYRENEFVVIGIEDFGIGISPQEKEKIFEQFYQAEKNKTYPGLGLGLYISKDIVARMGGKMWVESEIGKGSTFYVSLPLYKGKHSTEKPL